MIALFFPTIVAAILLQPPVQTPAVTPDTAQAIAPQPTTPSLPPTSPSGPSGPSDPNSAGAPPPAVVPQQEPTVPPVAPPPSDQPSAPFTTPIAPADSTAPTAPPPTEQPGGAATTSPTTTSPAPPPAPAPDPDAPIVYSDKSPPPATVEFSNERPAPFKPGFSAKSVPEEKIQYTDPPGRQRRVKHPEQPQLSPFDRKPPPGEPQRFAFEFKFGPFRPDIDKAYKGPGDGPYRRVFGKTNKRGEVVGAPPLRLLTIVGFEWQFLHLAGPLAVATSIGYFRDSADSLLTMPPTDPNANLRSNADETTFQMVPITLQLGYRFEWAANRYHVPLIPYAKGGFLYGIWWSTDGNGKLARDASTGKKTRGGSPGWQADFGMMLRLTDFDRTSSKKLNTFTGINHLNFFGEYRFSQTGTMGRKTKPNVGGATWMAGMAIEF